MRDQAAETLVGALVLLVAGLFLVYSLNTSGERRGGGYPLSVEFASAEGLAIGSDVRISGVKVGSVASVTLDPASYQAKVGFVVDDAVTLPIDTSVSMRTEGLLGGVYLDLEPGGEAEMLAAGDELDYGQGAIDILKLLAEFVQRMDRDE